MKRLPGAPAAKANIKKRNQTRAGVFRAWNGLSKPLPVRRSKGRCVVLKESRWANVHKLQTHRPALCAGGFRSSADFQCEHALHRSQRHTDVAACQRSMTMDDT